MIRALRFAKSAAGTQTIKMNWTRTERHPPFGVRV